MNSSNSFLKTLKRIGYLEADYLDESDFQSMVSEKELKSFFEVFSSMNEKNVLTTEEIEELGYLKLYFYFSIIDLICWKNCVVWL